MGSLGLPLGSMTTVDWGIVLVCTSSWDRITHLWLWNGQSAHSPDQIRDTWFGPHTVSEQDMSRCLQCAPLVRLALLCCRSCPGKPHWGDAVPSAWAAE